jgi:serine/threonine protein kinase
VGKFLRGGESAGPWLLGRLLGSGGMGSVHEASDDSGRKVALKVLAKDASAETVQRFGREVEAIRGIRDPHIVGFVEADLNATPPWLAMRLIEGRSLASDLKMRRKSGPGAFPHPDAEAFAIQIARGLSAAHAKGLVHRDLKPGNVMITRARRAILVDFGLAHGPDSESLTGTGEVLGSVVNIPPEHLGGGRAGPTGDVYQWGLIVHELLVGGLPFPDVPPFDAVYTRAVTPPPPPGPLPDRYAHIARVVAESLQPDPLMRPEDGESLVRRLESLV